MPSAFVSHSSPDDRYVQEMVQYLRALGYSEVFNDSHTIEPDERFWERIERGIRECDAFVVILSHASVRSYWVDREVQFARDLGKRVIPIRIDDCKLPASFDGRDVIELRQGRGDKTKLAPSRITKHSPKTLFGRDHWLDALDAAWANPRLNVYSLIAWGGVGKTSLVAHWVSQRMAAKGWPGVERYFDWSFYSQGTGESRQTSSDQFIQEALTFFDDLDPTRGSPWERGERLARLIRHHRTLLVLDGIEPLQYPVNDPQAGRLKDHALEALLQSLAADNLGLCILTSREHLANIESHATTAEEKLDALVKEAAVALLRHLQVVGTEAEMEAAWRDAGGHALTLQLLGRFLADAHGGDIRHYKEVKFEDADLERQGRSAFKVMIAYERWLQSAGAERQRELAVLRLTGLFDRPISRGSLQALRAEPPIPGLTDTLAGLKETQWNIALKRLSDASLLTVTPDAIDAHPLIREYFALHLRKMQPEAFQAGHSRLFDHLCESTPHRPDTLADLEPLYEAVTHGCLAGRHHEACDKVYYGRILRGDVYYSFRTLGAVGADLGALAAFFDVPWRRLAPGISKQNQSWLLGMTAICLNALGRLSEAVEPMRVSLERYVDAGEWKQAAIAAGNLCELEVTLGRLNEAVADGHRSIELAGRAGGAFRTINSYSTAADALHRSGEWAEAGALFAEAERIQAADQPEFPWLYSSWGFRYVDWLLAPAELLAWGCEGMASGNPCCPTRSAPPKAEASHAAALAACEEAEERAKRTLERMAHNPGSLLEIALDQLTLTRAALYRSLLAQTNDLRPTATALGEQVATALASLRRANSLYQLPNALLTAAFYHGTLGADPEQSHSLLAEAQQIAERGPMPLYLADVHLYRARLFRDRTELARARELIKQHGYGRRYDELADAEAAAANW